MRRNNLAFWAFGTLICASGCGSSPPSTLTVAPPITTIEMEPMVFTAEGAFDAKSLYDDAENAYISREFEICEQKHQKLINIFPTSRYALTSHYNRGLCLERLKRFDDALGMFRFFVDNTTSREDKADGQYHIGRCFLELGRAAEAKALFDLLIADDPNPDDLSEALLRRGHAFVLLGDFDSAEKDFRHSIENCESIYGERPRGHAIYAETAYRLGALEQKHMEAVPLLLPLEKMQADLAEKIRLFKKAQHFYLSSVSVQQADWSPAAGTGLGILYKQFAEDVLKAEVPAELNSEERKYYDQELVRVVRPIFEQSLDIFEQNIEMGARLGGDEIWRKESEASLEILRTWLKEHPVAVDPKKSEKAS